MRDWSVSESGVVSLWSQGLQNMEKVTKNLETRRLNVEEMAFVALHFCTLRERAHTGDAVCFSDNLSIITLKCQSPPHVGIGFKWQTSYLRDVPEHQRQQGGPCRVN